MNTGVFSSTNYLGSSNISNMNHSTSTQSLNSNNSGSSNNNNNANSNGKNIFTGKSNDILLPVVLWCGAPAHWITSIIITPDKKSVITGSQSGHLAISSISLDQGKENQFIPKILSIGHETAITCLALGEYERKEVVVSAGSDGSMAVWNITDGLCLLSTPPHFLSCSPSSMVALSNKKQVAVVGKGSNSIYIIDIHNLKIVSTLSEHKDWITSLFACTVSQDSIPILLSGSLDGTIRFWSLKPGEEDIPLQTLCLYNNNNSNNNNSTKKNQDDSPLSIEFSPNGKSLLVVCKNHWSIFTTHNSHKLWSIDCPQPRGWFGGSFVNDSLVLVWTREGRSFLYKIDQTDLKSFSLGHPIPLPGTSPLCTVDYSKSLGGISSSLSKSYGSLSSSLAGNNGLAMTSTTHQQLLDYTIINFSYISEGANIPTLVLTFSNESSKDKDLNNNNNMESNLVSLKIGAAMCWSNVFLIGDPFGKVKIWVIPVNSIDNIQFPPPSGKRAPLRDPNLVGTISDAWRNCESRGKTKVTASLVLDDLMLLIRGYEDGSISTSKLPTDLLTKFHTNSHNSKVNYLMSSHPGNSKRLLFSASNDCTIKVWDLASFKLLHTFSHHTGPVMSITPLPHPRKNTFISISEDKTIGMYSMEDLSCKHMFGVHQSSIQKVHWKSEQGYLLVETIDGSVSIWEIGSGELEGVVYGQIAKDILDNSEILSNDWKHQTLCGYGYGNSSSSNCNFLTQSLVYSHKNDPPIQTIFLNIKTISDEISRINDSIQNNYSGVIGAAAKKELTQLVSIFSYLIPWGMDKNLDPMYKKDFQLRPPQPDFTFGLLGHGGNMSFLTPLVSGTSGKLQCSDTLTAQTTLAAVSLARTILKIGGVENVCSQLTTFYCAILPDTLQGYVYPDYSYLTTYCQDSSDDVMISARSIFRTSIERMPQAAFKQLVNSYVDLLNTENGLSPFERSRSIIVLAIIASNRPNDFNNTFSSRVGLELQKMIYKGTGNLTVIAVELIGKGFSLWKDSIKDTPGLLKCIFSLTMQAEPLASTAKNSLLLIGSVDPRNFIQVIGDEISNESTGTTSTINAIVMVGSLIKKDPDSVLPFLPRVIDSIIKSLDPHTPTLREACLRQTTAVLHIMVRKYPMVSFHHDSQRLVLGTLDGFIVIYDLKTATRWHKIEAYPQSFISCITFNDNGKALSSYSSKENVIKIWQTSSSFFGLLGSQFSCTRTISTPFEKIIPKTPQIIPKIENIRIQWSTPSSLILMKDESSFSINIDPIN
ncbi:hypothetical protein CYY_002533 [Polysphondylium violaceum]|uniref:WD40 repeat-containing protein n=1 Tax=Polysphondylium violaceum TaxID=133409 RepID=A0A8J4PYQ6_9MYCE|nr:hypothetical protein CYY_002533 [Polysphondylium violaceum]